MAYIGGQCLGLELYAKGILNHNREKLQWANEILQAPERLLKIMTLSRISTEPLSGKLCGPFSATGLPVTR